MRALIFHGPDLPLEVATRDERPVLSDGQVRVRILCTTICGSDLHTLHGRRSTATPAILGHEIVGIVDEVSGTDVQSIDGRGVSPGDRVTWSVVVPCGSCMACRRQRSAGCTARFKYGHESDVCAPWSGGLAEVCLLRRGTAIAHVPNGLDDALAASAACAGATAAAALRRAGGVIEDHVVVFGTGLLGLSLIDFAKQAGARHVVAVDVDATRLERARAFGADAVVLTAGRDGADVDVLASLRAFCTEGFDAAFECSGSSAAAQTAIASLAVLGRAVLVGAVFKSANIELAPEDLVRRRLSVFGQHNYEPEDLVTALGYLAASRAPYAGCFGAALSFEDFAQLSSTSAASATHSGQLRSVVVPAR